MYFVGLTKNGTSEYKCPECGKVEYTTSRGYNKINCGCKPTVTTRNWLPSKTTGEDVFYKGKPLVEWARKAAKESEYNKITLPFVVVKKPVHGVMYNVKVYASLDKYESGLVPCNETKMSYGDCY